MPYYVKKVSETRYSLGTHPAGHGSQPMVSHPPPPGPDDERLCESEVGSLWVASSWVLSITTAFRVRHHR